MEHENRATESDGRPLTWRCVAFGDLDAQSLYEAMALRQAIFVVEQNCPYLDADGLDPQCFHLLGRNVAGHLLAYLRIVPPGVRYPEASIGRLVTAQAARGKGYARDAMVEGLAIIAARYPTMPVRIQAQSYLQQFYEGLEFTKISEEYLEDGIPHIDMRCLMK